ncbi:MAG: NADH-quinone oxidoreductase subunit C [Verrucomicrobiales bacterium]|nr:NADH-quinone oxidoreductase subunit C [Verrucomicrobiales bacterium]
MNELIEQLKSAYAVLVVPARADTQAAAVPAVVQPTDPERRGCHLAVTVTPAVVVEAAQVANRFGFAIDTITGIDWPEAGQMEVVYDFFHPQHRLHLVVRTRVPRDAPALPTIQDVFPGANWHERETHDFFGIKFIGHPDLTPLLLPEDADYHPLRKDFTNVSRSSN